MSSRSEKAALILQREDRGGVAILTLNRPAKLNALSNDLLAKTGKPSKHATDSLV